MIGPDADKVGLALGSRCILMRNESNVFEITTQYNCNLQAFPPNSVKRMSTVRRDKTLCAWSSYLPTKVVLVFLQTPSKPNALFSLEVNWSCDHVRYIR